MSKRKAVKAAPRLRGPKPITLSGGERLRADPQAPARGAEAVSRERLASGPGYVRGEDDDGLRFRRADVFDRMEWAAQRARVDFFLTPGQVSAGRRYGYLVERVASGLSARSTLSALLPQGGAGGGELSAMDYHLDAARQLDRAVIAIGRGVAKPVRRVRPSDRGGPDRKAITDRALVDAVALHGEPLDNVLRAHGWGVKGASRAALQVALAEALERLRGVLR
ncbi:hypothetical protein JI664_03590 [Rhodobacter sp. NTK016B]|uniref:hypothetical protein n=1 Tax=Rhodobacter sp. NTK016B TaxID=2759676 RepID=UPI001A8E4932|nr:hypothetical protein [Rhodobacter sp. NTK016B]MBN8291040.1 hypothetical protein [Rhodobacter sp. NTK016B]